MHDLLPITASGWWADDLTLPLAVQLGLWLVRPRSMGLSNALRDRDIHFCEIGEIVDAAKTPDEHPTAVDDGETRERQQRRHRAALLDHLIRPQPQ